MARQGTAKFYSVQQEDYMAKLFDGKRSASSGAAEHDAGDVRCEYLLIECKVKMPKPTAVSQPKPQFIRQLETVAKEAYETGKDPALALRFFDSSSPLAGPDGWIDVVVVPANVLVDREEEYVKVRSQEFQARQVQADQESGEREHPSPVS
jgi:hypothetical protein